MHHEFHEATTIASEYANPLEVIFCNTAALIAGPVLLGIHPAVFCVWFILRLAESCDAHCGYAFPWSPFNLFPSIQVMIIDTHDHMYIDRDDIYTHLNLKNTCIHHHVYPCVV